LSLPGKRGERCTHVSLTGGGQKKHLEGGGQRGGGNAKERTQKASITGLMKIGENAVFQEKFKKKKKVVWQQNLTTRHPCFNSMKKQKKPYRCVKEGKEASLGRTLKSAEGDQKKKKLPEDCMKRQIKIV